MDDDYGDLQNAQLIFPKTSVGVNFKKDLDFEKCTVYLGESVESFVVLTCPPNCNKTDWKSRIKLVAAHGSFSQTETNSEQISNSKNRTVNITSDPGSNDFIDCQVTSTYNKSIFKKETASNVLPATQQNINSFFQDNETFVFPLRTVLTNISGQCTNVKLIVTIWLCISPKKVCREQEAKKDFQGSSLLQLRKKIVQQKILTKELTVINPPLLSIRHVSAGDKQLILCLVNNDTSHTLHLHNMCILPNRSAGNGDSDDVHESTNGKCVCSPLTQVSYPVQLLSQEKLSCVFHLIPPHVDADTIPVDIILKAHLNWSQKKDIEVVTLYSLPTLAVRRAPFTVSVVCKEEPKIGENFILTYRIANNLQDFLSMKLYWNLDTQWNTVKHLDDDHPQKKRIEQMRHGIVCQDPDIHVGACPLGSTVPVDVNFQLLRPGLYEFGEFMKVNLRYALPDSQSTLKQDSVGTPASTETVSTLSAEDELAASAELWRDRSGSTSSLQTPLLHSVEEKRKSFATKSYSFGDLAPNISSDSEETQKMRFKSIKRSTAVYPARPPPPRPLLPSSDRDVTNPANFLKKPCKIYIPHNIL